MSALIALANPRRIKASHRRRRKAASGLKVQRYYDPGIGRMLSMDPVTAYSSGDMRHFNGYAYAFNNPYRFKDPDGREAACVTLGVNCFNSGGTFREKATTLGAFAGMLIGGLAGGAITMGATQQVAQHGVVGATLANADKIAAGTVVAAEAVAGTQIAARGGIGPVLKGQQGVAQSVAAATARGEQVLGKEISLSASGVTTRPDLLVRKPDGALKFIESKCGAGACLTPNQRSGFPVIEAGGAVPRGGNAAAAGLQPGQPLGATEVQVDWWP